MQLKRLLLLLPLALLLICSSCKKNYSDEQYIEDPNDSVPDLSVKLRTSVSGFIVDENNKPLGGAQVISGTKQATTDEFGYFKISNTMLPEKAGYIAVNKTGYYHNFRAFNVKQDAESFVRLKMLVKTETGTVDAAMGGTVAAADGAKVILPANGFVNASSGNGYSGQVHVSARKIDMADNTDMQLSVPGDGRGIDTDGKLRLLRSYAAIAVELTGNNGEKLQIATGKKASITIPIAASMLAAAPANVPLWSMDETTGLWKQESSATKNGNVYTGEVSHFSFWEGADPSVLVNFTAQIVNEALQPLANVPVIINVAGQPVNAGYGRFGYTDANGMVGGPILANSSLILDIATPCAIGAYSHSFSTGTSNVDLGTLTGNLGQGMVTITGNVVNCSGQPVTDGYVQTFDGAFYNRININNGSFTFSGIACTNSNINYIAVDRTTNQQNDPQSILLVSGANNLGTVTACGISTISILSYTFDGTTYNLGDPNDTLAVYNTSATSTQVVTLDRAGPGFPGIGFEIRGPGIIGGSNNYITDIWLPQFPSGRGINWTGIPITFTEYGNVGGFVSGNSPVTQVLDFEDNSIHTVSLNFRIKRYY